MDEEDKISDSENQTKPEKMFTLKRWNSVAMWSWDCSTDTCAICRVQVNMRKLINLNNFFLFKFLMKSKLEFSK